MKIKTSFFKFYPYLIVIICMVCSSCEQCYNDLNYEKLATAVCKNDVAQAKALIQQGAPVYDRCYGSLWHALSEAPARMTDPVPSISKETIDFVDSLHLDVNHEDRHGETALFRYHCTKEILERLLQRGADINHRRDDGHTALTSLYNNIFMYDDGAGEKIDDVEWAEFSKRLDLLIDHGADVNILVKGKTMLDYLLEPLDPFLSRKTATSPERYRASRQRIIEYLISRGADAGKIQSKVN